MKSYHIIVHGTVQGVFFRQSTQAMAVQLAINGYVRNCPDGTVQIEAEGNDHNIQKFVTWCHEGPPKAKVTHIDIHEQGLKNFSSFELKR